MGRQPPEEAVASTGSIASIAGPGNLRQPPSRLVLCSPPSTFLPRKRRPRQSTSHSSHQNPTSTRISEPTRSLASRPPTKRVSSSPASRKKYTIVIAGAIFGCGSSREYAPVALGASGTAAVVAESYARIFFRNAVATGEVYPLESEGRLCEECRTGDVVTIEMKESKLINHTTGKEYVLKSIGDAGPVIEAGGIFAYSRKTGMIPSR